jgi:hypothetical protein
MQPDSDSFKAIARAKVQLYKDKIVFTTKEKAFYYY